ncbi:hypothetical protein Tco_0080974 [Tanacetum coccineum]
MEEVTINLLKKMDEERDKVELFGSCSHGIVEMDEVDGEKEEFKDIDVLVSDLMLGKNERCSWGLDHIDESDANLDYDCS